MSTQKALFLEGTHGRFVVGDRNIPKPGLGEVLVKIHATALNPIEWKIQHHGLPFVTKFPAVLGQDAAGTIEAVGEGVELFIKGDRVVHQGTYINDNATFQQYALVPAEIVAKIPSKISFEQAASLPTGIATAALGLYGTTNGAGFSPPWEDGGRNKYKSKPIVLFGGSTSVGQYVIQFAKMSGFSPIIVTASPHNAAHLRALGATHVLGRDADVAAEVVRIAGGAPVKIVFDTVGAEATQRAAWGLLAPGGQAVFTIPAVSGVGGDEGTGRSVVQVNGNVYVPVNRAVARSLYSRLTHLLEVNLIQPNRIEVLPDGLQGIFGGLERLRKGDVSGAKLVVNPQETV